jgi:cytochrome bd ubiquinol oxidase subunit I
MNLDPVLLARMQFGWTIAFHIVFPSMSIGLALFLTIIEAMWLATRRPIYLTIYRFWSTIFAMGFGMGVVSGIVLSFEFGLLFSRFAQMAGPVLGPVIGLEVLTAFFLEAGFLGIMLFGFGRVGDRLHFAATCLVAFGTALSASWILSANSWMQHPVAYHLDHGRLVADDWLRVVVNPEWPLRIAHMLLASWISTALLISGVSAYYLLRRRHIEFAKTTFGLALWFITALIPLQLYVGDSVARVVAPYQPAKIEAMEGSWVTPAAPAPWLLFILPDQAHQRNTVEVGVPLLGSLMTSHDLKTYAVPGLSTTPRDQQPNMAIPFYGFHIMIIVGLAIFTLACCAIILRLRGRLFDARWFQQFAIAMTPAGFICILAGWSAAEVGRQPYVIYGVLRTADAVSPVSGLTVLGSFVAFVIVYSAFFLAFCFLTGRVIEKGPSDAPLATNPSAGVRRAFITAGAALPGTVPSAVGARQGSQES